METRLRTSGKPRVQRLMNALVLILLLALPLTSLVARTSAVAQAASSAAQANQSGSRVLLLVKFRASASSTDIAAAINGAGGQDARALNQIHTHVVSVPAQSAAAVMAALQKHAAVEHVAAAIKLSKASLPDDPGYAQQWALPQISWDQAYGSVSVGGSATIAVLDTGVDASHPDLTGRMTAGFSAFSADSSVANTDPNGHGTELAGIAAAAVNNGTGMAGVDYAGAGIAPVQVLGADGTGYDSDVVSGVLWAADNGANVILMGFSSPDYSSALADAVAYAESKGVVVVAATGNGGSSDPTYPAGIPGVIGVAGTDQSDNLTSSSNTGSASVAAPGDGIYATQAGGGYGFVSGTSPAAAEVAGLAALLIANGDSASQTANQIRSATDPIAGQSFGRINVSSALGPDVAPVATAPPSATPTASSSPPVYVAASNMNVKGHVFNGGSTTGIANATVTCINCTINGHETTSSNATGAYTFNPGPNFPGTINAQFCASAPGFNSQLVTISAPNGTSTFTLNFHLTIGSNTTCVAYIGGVPTQLAFVTGPQTLTAGTKSGTITVVLEDANGNAITPSANLTVNLTSSAGTGKFYDSTGTTQITSVVIPSSTTSADFLYFDTTVGTPTITASSGGLTPATQVETVTAAGGDHLVFNTIASTTAGASLDAPGGVTVSVEDAFNNVVTGSTAAITVSITSGTGTSGATLSGTKTVNAINGVATFTGLSIDKVGTGYTLSASASGPLAGTSNLFNITAGAATKLVVNGYPSPTNAGATHTFTVTAVDAFGNTATGYSGTVHFTSSDGQAVLPADSTLTNGVGTFNATLKTATGTVPPAAGQSITATDTVTPSITGSQTGIQVNAAAAANLVFGQQPTNSTVGAYIAPPVTVKIVDQFGNVVSSTAAITLTLTVPNGATLGGTTTQNAVAGTASFGDLWVNKTGTYTLSAASTGLTGTVSASFIISAAPATLPVCTIGSTSTNGSGQKYVPVTIQDSDDGLQSIQLTYLKNSTLTPTTSPTADTVGQFIPVTQHFTGAFTITATKINQTLSSAFEYQVKDMGGNTVTCDPVMMGAIRSAGTPVSQDVPGLTKADHLVSIVNDKPGVQNLTIVVNGHNFVLRGLVAGQHASLDIASALVDGANTVSVVTTGQPGGTANLLFSNI